jgi:hypothetical protein
MTRGAKYKPEPLNLFTICSKDFETKLFIDFKIYCDELIDKGFRSGCEMWWKSRFYEFIKGDQQNKSDAEFEYKSKAQINWQLIWNKIEPYLITFLINK